MLLIAQLAAVVLSALVSLSVASQPFALAVAVGGIGVAAGAWLAARFALPEGVISAGAAMTRVLLGAVLKWSVLFAALLLGVWFWRLPPAGLLIGVIVALAMQVLWMVRRLG
jgi:ATP synthase protein I